MPGVSHAKKISNIKQLRGDLSFRGFYNNLSFKTVEGAVLNFMVFVRYVGWVCLLLFFWDKKLMCIKLILLRLFAACKVICKTDQVEWNFNVSMILALLTWSSFLGFCENMQEFPSWWCLCPLLYVVWRIIYLFLYRKRIKFYYHSLQVIFFHNFKINNKSIF